MATEQPSSESGRDADIRLTFLRKVLELASGAFSLAAALAWNDAIQALFVKLFGSASTLAAKFCYAILVTLVVVTILLRLSRVMKRMETRLPNTDH